jgi:hypothetical protein
MEGTNDASSARTQQIATVEAALCHFAAPGQAAEVRAIKQDGKTLHAILADMHALAVQAAAWDAAEMKGTYVVFNPVRPDLVGAHCYTHDKDIVSRRWFMIDIDPVRPADTNTTIEERNAAWSVMESAAATLQPWGMVDGVLVDSGNGYQLFYPIDLPNDEPTKQMLKATLKALSAICSDRTTEEDDQAIKNGEALETPKAKIDTQTFNASRMGKLAATRARKAEHTFDRPQRYARLIDGMSPPWSAAAAQANNLALPKVLDILNRILDSRRGRPETNLDTYVAAALRQACEQVTSAPVGDRNNRLFRSAASMGELIGAAALSRSEAEEALTAAAKSAGLQDGEIPATVKSGIDTGIRNPRDLSNIGAPRDGNPPQVQDEQPASEQASEAASEPTSSRPPPISAENIATVNDLITAGAKVEWIWPGWIQLGVLTGIGATAGTGKTRFCADLLRRIRHGKGWPDGAAIEIPADALSLWVVSDNHHDEMVTLSQSFGIVDSIRLNAYKSDPYGGVCLEEKQDLKDLEARVAILRPLFVVIDTVGNATDKNLCKQEDAKSFYFPLQIMARRYRTAILCLTHLNADGHFLGRRVMEKVRVAIRMEQPDEDSNRRRLEVVKSNSQRPHVLGVTMGDEANEYDTNPPPRADAQERRAPGPPPEKVKEAVAWLSEWLKGGPQRVSKTRTEAELRGYSAGTIYRAKEVLAVEEFEAETKKWWQLKAKET